MLGGMFATGFWLKIRRFLGHVGRAALVLWHAGHLLLVLGLPVALVWYLGWLGFGLLCLAVLVRACIQRPDVALLWAWVFSRH